MTVERYSTTSPYAATPQLSWRIGRYVHRDIPSSDDDTQIVLEPKYEFRPDLLAYSLYGTPSFWWVFSVRNPSLRFDPVYGMTPGLVIFAPSPERLRRILGA